MSKIKKFVKKKQKQQLVIKAVEGGSVNNNIGYVDCCAAEKWHKRPN